MSFSIVSVPTGPAVIPTQDAGRHRGAGRARITSWFRGGRHRANQFSRLVVDLIDPPTEQYIEFKGVVVFPEAPRDDRSGLLVGPVPDGTPNLPVLIP